MTVEGDSISGLGSRRECGRSAVVLFLVALVVYAYFYQGIGDNQKAHFDTTRAVVDHHTFDIGRYAVGTGDEQNTRDVSVAGGHVYSNKPPGLGLLATPVYLGCRAVERRVGVDPDSPAGIEVNEYVATLFTAGLPTAAMAAGVYVAVRRRGGREGAVALAVAGLFAVGTMVWPYSGLMMSHAASGAGLFLAWLLLTGERDGGQGRALLAAALLGSAVVVDYLNAPPAGLIAVSAWVMGGRQAGARLGAVVALAGLAAGVALVGWYNAVHFGSPLRVSQLMMSSYKTTGLWLGMFGWPDPRRLYWLTFQPLRGVFYSSPVLMLGVLGPLITREWRRLAIPLAVVGYFLLFNLSFNGWTGGWGVAARYLIPALPFWMVMVAPAVARWPVLSGVLGVVSVANMLALTAVNVMTPAAGDGPPPPLADPLRDCWANLLAGRLALNPGAFNVGQHLGLVGRVSLLPVVLVLAGFLVWAVRDAHRLPRPEEAAPSPAVPYAA